MSDRGGLFGASAPKTVPVKVIPLIPTALARGNRSIGTKDQFDARKSRVQSQIPKVPPLNQTSGAHQSAILKSDILKSRWLSSASAGKWSAQPLRVVRAKGLTAVFS